MKRKIYNKLLEWKKNSNGHSSLLVEGARRVGKSYIVEEFGRNEYKSYMLIDFSKVGDNVKTLFDDLMNITELLQNLCIAMDVELYDRQSLVIFDEIQFFPRAREALKSLVADGRYDYIETGSLISIHENVKDILIPSEEESIQMYPMDFEEFCWAMGDETTVRVISEHYEKKTPLENQIHKTIMKKFRKYMLVGGMPQVVNTYAETKDFQKAEDEKKKIIKLYREDISKKSKRNRIKTTLLFNSIPTELNKHDKRINVTDFDNKGKMQKYDEPIYWLTDSKIVNCCYDTTIPSVGMNMNVKTNSIKMFMGDTGLLVTMTIEVNEKTENDIYNALLLDKLHINEGMFTENIVAQTLVANGHRLFSHSYYKGNNEKNRYEIDFLVRDGKKICPIEVKSSDYKSHSSLDYIMETYSKTVDHPVIVYTKNLSKEKGVLFIPIYMTICL